MLVENIVYIILSFVVSALIAWFYYYDDLKNKGKVSFILAFLRFLSLLSVLLLLINPKFNTEEIEIVKPKLVVAVDNSVSIKHLADTSKVLRFVNDLQSNIELDDKFDVELYSFSNELKLVDTLDFNGYETNISSALREVKSIYNQSRYPIVLVTDGNQTIGSSYEYLNMNQSVFPIVVGDTAKYADLSITQLNVNKYSYLNNKFPVEVFLNYEGNGVEKSILNIYEGRQKVYSKQVNFSSNTKSQSLSLYLPASKVGVHYYNARLEHLEGEKNSVNNARDFIVEVIDEQSKTLLLTSVLHPDIGSFKESIEMNEQRSVDVKFIHDQYEIKDYNSVILYQPTVSFKSIFDEINSSELNYLIVTGSQTDWNFLNSIQTDFTKKVINQTEDYLASFSPSFTTFSQEDIGFESFPPLTDSFGEVIFKVPIDVLLWKKVGSFLTREPLLASYEKDQTRVVLLFGENSWRWRMKANIQNESFIAYDNLMSKILQFLSSSKRFKRLSVDSESLYYSNNKVRIKAGFMNKNYEFDPTAGLWIKLKHSETGKVEKIPFSIVGNSYTVVMPNLDIGDYEYVVSVEGENIIKNGKFKVVDFNIERQFLSADVDKLRQISERTKGELYYLENTDLLVDKLMNDKRYLPVKRSQIKIESLIDWKWLLGLIILSLSTEWFIRKYKGLI